MQRIRLPKPPSSQVWWNVTGKTHGGEKSKSVSLVVMAPPEKGGAGIAKAEAYETAYQKDIVINIVTLVAKVIWRE